MVLLALRHQLGSPARMGLQKQVAGVEDVSLHSGKIHKPRVNLRNFEEGIVATPEKQRPGLVRGQIVGHLVSFVRAAPLRFAILYCVALRDTAWYSRLWRYETSVIRA